MADQQYQATIDRLLQVIKAEMPDEPEGMSREEFDHLCRNIARAIASGIEMHEERRHSIAPEFGEPDRPEG